MKQSKQCPKCKGTVLHVQHAMNSTKYKPDQIGRLAQSGSISAGTVLGLPSDEVEAVVCKLCGYLELYVRDPGLIEADGEAIREL